MRSCMAYCLAVARRYGMARINYGRKWLSGIALAALKYIYVENDERPERNEAFRALRASLINKRSIAKRHRDEHRALKSTAQLNNVIMAAINSCKCRAARSAAGREAKMWHDIGK